MESKFVQSGDIKIHYLEWDGDGPPIVFLHGAGLCAMTWKPMAEMLSPKFRVLAVDLRGHGDSDKPPKDQYEWYQVSGDLPNLIDALGLDNVLLVGHSRGGGVGVIGGAQRAERISGAVLLEPNVPYIPPGADGAFMKRMKSLAERAHKRRAVWDSREQIFNSYRTRDAFKNWRPDALHAYIDGGTRIREDGKVELKCSPWIEAAFYECKPPEGMLEIAANARWPILFMTRAHQNELPPPAPSIQALEKAATSFRRVAVPDTDHFIPQEQPEAVVQAILDFAGVNSIVASRS